MGVGVLLIGSIVGTALSRGTAPTPSPTRAPSHYQLGSQARIGNTWLVTVNSATLNAGTATFAPDTGNAFLVVDVSLTNVSSREQTVSSLLEFTLKDAGGQQYTVDYLGVAAVGGTTPDSKVEAGGLLRGQLVYQVPTTMHPFTVAFQPALSSSQTIWDISNPRVSAMQQPTQAPRPTQAPTVAPEPTATPQPTANPNASAPAYVASILPQLSGMTTAFDNVGASCSAGDLATCRNDLQLLHNEVANFQSTLDKNPAPPCLQQVDAQIRAALTDFHEGATLAIRGLDTENTADVEAAGRLFTSGGAKLQDAATSIEQAHC